MAKSVMSLPILSFLLLLLSFNPGGILGLAYGQAPGQGSWCIAKPSSSDEELMANINYACGQVSCNILRDGSPCSNPDSLINHASIAMNLYYQSVGRHFWNCNFTNSGVIVVTDPSYGNCIYQFA